MHRCGGRVGTVEPRHHPSRMARSPPHASATCQASSPARRADDLVPGDSATTQSRRDTASSSAMIPSMRPQAPSASDARECPSASSRSRAASRSSRRRGLRRQSPARVSLDAPVRRPWRRPRMDALPARRAPLPPRLAGRSRQSQSPGSGLVGRPSAKRLISSARSVSSPPMRRRSAPSRARARVRRESRRAREPARSTGWQGPSIPAARQATTSSFPPMPRVPPRARAPRILLPLSRGAGRPRLRP